MEGSKGGSNGQEKWFTPYKSVKKRWLDYEKHRRLKGLPIIGSLHLFTKLWKQHKEVREFKACGHAKCDMCGQIQVEKAKFEGRNDDEARQRMRELHEEQVRCSLAAVCARARAPAALSLHALPLRSAHIRAHAPAALSLHVLGALRQHMIRTTRLSGSTQRTSGSKRRPTPIASQH